MTRMLAAATAATGKLLAEVVSEGSSSASRTGRSLLVSTVALGIAAALAVLAAGSYADYLSGGALGRAALTTLAGMGACVAAVAVWGALTRRAWSEVRAAAGRLLQDAGPNLIVVTVAVAWSVGLLGLLGVGPVQPGWLTLAGTGLLVAITLVEGRRRPAESMVSDVPTAGDPSRGNPLADEPISAHNRRRRFRRRRQASDVEVKIGAHGESDVRADEPAPK